MSNSFYRAFEDRYRGSRELIKSRLQDYAPFITELSLSHAPAQGLDLGCGRGEWLELLSQHGVHGKGVDLDEGMLAACRELGLEVATADALATLRAAADASLSVVSAFHLVEHLPFDSVHELISQALRVLQPGGLLIMETPNPENLVVGASNFYTDPSHIKPIPANLLAFATEFHGFARSKIVRLNEPANVRGNEKISLLSVLEGVSPDYSVIAQKTAEPELMARFSPLFEATFGVGLAMLATRYDTQHATIDNAPMHAQIAELNRGATFLDQSLAAHSVATQEGLNQMQGRISHLEQVLTEKNAATLEAVAMHKLEMARMDLLLSQQVAGVIRDVATLGSDMVELQARTAAAAGQTNVKVGRRVEDTLRQQAVAETQSGSHRELMAAQARANLAESNAASLLQSYAALERLAQERERQLLAVWASTSWWVTKPLRAFARPALIRRVAGALRRRAGRLLRSMRSLLQTGTPARDAARETRNDAASAGLATAVAAPSPLGASVKASMTVSAQNVLEDLQRDIFI